MPAHDRTDREVLYGGRQDTWQLVINFAVAVCIVLNLRNKGVQTPKYQIKM